jgi:hypothetical protein
MLDSTVGSHILAACYSYSTLLVVYYSGVGWFWHATDVLSKYQRFINLEVWHHRNVVYKGFGTSG